MPGVLLEQPCGIVCVQLLVFLVAVSKIGFYRYNGHFSAFLNLAPRFRVIEPPDRPGLNLRLVVRLNHPICDQNEPKNVHYLPVVAPRMILQDAPNNDFQVLGPPGSWPMGPFPGWGNF